MDSFNNKTRLPYFIPPPFIPHKLREEDSVFYKSFQIKTGGQTKGKLSSGNSPKDKKFTYASYLIKSCNSKS